MTAMRYWYSIFVGTPTRERWHWWRHGVLRQSRDRTAWQRVTIEVSEAEAAVVHAIIPRFLLQLGRQIWGAQIETSRSTTHYIPSMQETER